ncbi:transposable element Tc1 transposase [Trichonephila clavipes]|nr:transposable element Tc1 transposase [Trichonephila clavipes]
MCANVGFSSIRRRLLHRGLHARVPLYRILLAANHRWLRLQWAHEHRAWQADRQQIVFSDESRFNLWDHDGRLRVRRSAGERCLPECVIERQSGLTHGVMVWGAISHQERSNFLRIEAKQVVSEAMDYSSYAKPMQSISPILQRHRRSSSFLPLLSNLGLRPFLQRSLPVRSNQGSLLMLSRSRAGLFPFLHPEPGSSP